MHGNNIEQPNYTIMGNSQFDTPQHKTFYGLEKLPPLPSSQPHQKQPSQPVKTHHN